MQGHRGLSTVARVDEVAEHCFLVTFVAGTAQRSVGVKPACTEAKKGIPPRPLAVGVVDEVVGGGGEGREMGGGGGGEGLSDCVWEGKNSVCVAEGVVTAHCA